MATPAIGAHQFLSMRSIKEIAGTGYDVITRRGVKLVRLRQAGGTPKTLFWRTERDWQTEAELDTAIETYKALQDALQTVTPEIGAAITNMAILDVKEFARFKIGTSTGMLTASPAFMQIVDWTLQPTA